MLQCGVDCGPWTDGRMIDNLVANKADCALGHTKSSTSEGGARSDKNQQRTSLSVCRASERRMAKRTKTENENKSRRGYEYGREKTVYSFLFKRRDV